MFNLSGSEIIVILLLALVILGPDKLPEAMRKAGRTFAELKKLSNGFQEEVRKGFEEPVREVKKTAAAVKSAAKFPIDTTSSTSDDKPRYNPAIDPPPSLPEGESVAEPLAVDEPADMVEAVSEAPIEVPDEPVEPAEPASDDVVAPAGADAEAESAT